MEKKAALSQNSTGQSLQISGRTCCCPRLCDFSDMRFMHNHAEALVLVSESRFFAQALNECAIIWPMSENKQCKDEWCGPAPFANTPPIGLAPELLQQQDVLPDWKSIAPELHEDSYATADALWWSRKLGQTMSLGADVAPLMRDEADARAVQQALAKAYDWWPATRAPRYWKSGGANRNVALLHVPLPETGVHEQQTLAAAPGTVFNMRGVEGEIALRLGQDLTAEQAEALDYTSALALIDALTVAIEWVDVRWRDGLKAPALALQADGQCHGGLALAPWQPLSALQGRDWAQQACVVSVNGQAQSFSDTHSLGDPAWLLVDWLQHVAREYGSVPAGTVVTTGSWCGCVALQAGDRFDVKFEGLGQLDWQF